VRYGGEEFLLILAGVELARAERVLERARAAVENEPIRAGAARVAVTFSAGLAERRPSEPRDALIARADAALYAAKRSGRNRVKLAR
jgi:diguanylate cyclase